ncbi:MAG: cell division protein FtsL [Hydrogenothermaceae bacterium]|nr:cell division protein FtsL [Hydrogenothermaceae bacterium]
MYDNGIHKVAIADLLVAIKRYKVSILISTISLIGLISYNHYIFRVESELYNLNKQKSLLISENFQLKKKISEISNPERISSVAKQELGMINARYEQVKFIETK